MREPSSHICIVAHVQTRIPAHCVTQANLNNDAEELAVIPMSEFIERQVREG